MIHYLLRMRDHLPEICWRFVRPVAWRLFWWAEEARERRVHGSVELPRLSGSERAVLLETICEHYPFVSLLEIGVGFGQNFHILSRVLPGVRFVGVDHDPGRVAAANELLHESEIGNATVKLADARSLAEFPTRSVDIVLSSASLLYIDERDIETVLSEMLRIARRAVILLEQSIHCPESPHGMRLPAAPDCGEGGASAYWVRDYPSLFSRLSPDSQIRSIRVPHPIWVSERWRECATVIEVTEIEREHDRKER